MKSQSLIPLCALMILAPALMGGRARADEVVAGVKLTHIAARVEIVPEDRADVTSEIKPGNSKLPAITVSHDGEKLVLDGGLPTLNKHHGSMNLNGGNMSYGTVYIEGYGDIRVEDLPQVTIHVPKALRLEADGYTFGHIGRTDSMNLSETGRFAWEVDKVAGKASIDTSGAGALHLATTLELELHQAGAADITFGDTHVLNIDLAGVGNIRGLKVFGPTRISLSGAGDVNLNRVVGDLDLSLSGMGNARIRDGHISHLKVDVSGMGNAQFDGTAGDVEASVSGMGSIHVEHATGRVTKDRSGMGSINIGH